MSHRAPEMLLSGKRLLGKESILPFRGEASKEKAVYVHEVAGRDSYAALKALLGQINSKNSFFILSLAVAPTEYGDLNQVEKYFTPFEDLLKKENFSYALSISRDSELWGALCGRFLSTIFDRYGFYTPCISCHAYFHILRAFIAIDSGAKLIVSGERVSHAGRVKVNQSEKSLRAYQEILRAYGIEILYPVKNIETEEELLKLLEMDWKEEENQMRCVFSGNYLSVKGKNLIREEQLDRYFEEFLIPAGKKIIEYYLEGNKEFLKAVESVVSCF